MGPEELNAEERLRIQLWDSDRTSADDDLGRIEVDLKELMHSSQSKGKMWDRTDGFLALEGAYAFNLTFFSKVQSLDSSRIWEVERNTPRPCFVTLATLHERGANALSTQGMRECLGPWTGVWDTSRKQGLKRNS